MSSTASKSGQGSSFSIPFLGVASLICSTTMRLAAFLLLLMSYRLEGGLATRVDMHLLSLLQTVCRIVPFQT